MEGVCPGAGDTQCDYQLFGIEEGTFLPDRNYGERTFLCDGERVGRFIPNSLFV